MSRVSTSISPIEFLAGPLNLVERIVLMPDSLSEGPLFGIGRQIGLHGYRRRRKVGGVILPDHYTALRFREFDGVLNLTDSST
jgi:hypothetical protein